MELLYLLVVFTRAHRWTHFKFIHANLQFQYFAVKRLVPASKAQPGGLPVVVASDYLSAHYG